MDSVSFQFFHFVQGLFLVSCGTTTSNNLINQKPSYHIRHLFCGIVVESNHPIINTKLLCSYSTVIQYRTLASSVFDNVSKIGPKFVRYYLSSDF